MIMRSILTTLAGLSMSTCLLAQEPASETLLSGLTNPSGVAVQPETGIVFVADSGTGRVVRVVEGKAEVVIQGFPLDSYGKEPSYAVGPLGLTFLDKDRLVVGGGGLPDGEELLRVYKLPAEGTIEASEMLAGLALPALDQLKGEGNFHGVVYIQGALYVSCNGDDSKGWIARAAVEGDKVGPLERAIASRELTGVDAPGAVTAAKDGSLVVGQLGEIDVANDSLLCFYEPSGGKLLAKYATGLHDITGLAFAPSGRLYAIEFAWMATDQGGLFQLVANRDNPLAVEARRLLTLDKPSAITFDDEGAAYITLFGSGDAEKPSGSLIKIPSGL